MSNPIQRAADEQLASADLTRTEARSINAIYGRMFGRLERKKTRRSKRGGRKVTKAR